MDEQNEKQWKEEELSLIYTGAEAFQPDAEKQKAYRLYPYMPSDDLREAVNLAIYLKRPLLIKGEPGSGKTRLAFAVAHEFSETYYKELKKEYERELLEKAAAGEGESEANPASGWRTMTRRLFGAAEGDAGQEAQEANPFEVEDDKGYPGWPFFFWPVKSTSQARDGLYVYDAVGRLHNATLPDHARKPDRVEDYINYGPLGKAFRYGALGKDLKSGKMRPIVLIDEIDKADIDFPNDLLIELEDPKFKVRELEDQEIKSEIDPIIFITSNDEKALPDAFLRRCIFYYINFPGEERLRDIIRKRLPDHDEDLVIQAVKVFMQVRKDLEDKKGKARKLPSTSELIDWVKVLHRNLKTSMADGEAATEETPQEPGPDEAIREEPEKLDPGEKLMVDQVVNLLGDQLPLLSVLIKNFNDYKEYISDYKEYIKQLEEKEKEKESQSTDGPVAAEDGEGEAS
jgi:MoxR-like ATPase